jgi:hypothetical protein
MKINPRCDKYAALKNVCFLVLMRELSAYWPARTSVAGRSIPTISPQELQPRSPPRAFEHWRFLLPLVRIDERYIGGFIAMR